MEMTLSKQHQQLGAQFVERDGFTLPQTYGNLHDEYDAMYFGAGVIDLAHFGALCVQGPDDPGAVDQRPGRAGTGTGAWAAAQRERARRRGF